MQTLRAWLRGCFLCSLSSHPSQPEILVQPRYSLKLRKNFSEPRQQDSGPEISVHGPGAKSVLGLNQADRTEVSKMPLILYELLFIAIAPMLISMPSV